MQTWIIVVAGFFAATYAASFRKEGPDPTPWIAPLLAEDSPTAVRYEYIVVFKDDVSDDTVRQHHSQLSEMMVKWDPQNQVMFDYHIGSFRGYSVILMDETSLLEVRKMEEVKYVERNQIVRLDAECNTQRGATWGITRTSQRDWQVGDNEYTYGDTGEGVDVYILDTGIDVDHPDFDGRARWGYDVIDRPTKGMDGHGHGTHVAGTVMSDTWGVAKKATSIAVKVLSNSGSGSTAGIIEGVEWVAYEHGREADKKSVANMSLGGGRSQSFNDAVNWAVAAGVHFAVSAGNDFGDACNKSPASAERPVTVAASDKNDQKSSFSNTGQCVDIIAPGTDVTSTWPNGGTNTISGTSMAAPHVAGVMAKLLTSRDISPEEMKAELKATATWDKIGGIPAGTDNDLLYYKNCD